MTGLEALLAFVIVAENLLLIVAGLRDYRDSFPDN